MSAPYMKEEEGHCMSWYNHQEETVNIPNSQSGMIMAQKGLSGIDMGYMVREHELDRGLGTLTF